MALFPDMAIGWPRRARSHGTLRTTARVLLELMVKTTRIQTEFEFPEVW